MTVKDIRKYINRLNNKKASETIFTRQISKTVDFAKVWIRQPRVTDVGINDGGRFEFFFIKNEFNEYVGAVYFMPNDLHWYIIPKYRKKGYLSNALGESILPYLFDNKNENIRITIQRTSNGNGNYLNSKGVALRLGFKPINQEETVFELNTNDFNWDKENIMEVYTQISSERFQVLKSRASFALKTLQKISDELSMTLDIDDDDDINQLNRIANRFYYRISDSESDNSATKDRTR
ncbi:hypothetical protein CLV98_1682 [Dyadobacter jejuensis]|uniref:Acetyltransferase (GNAT) family protein n=1 Tax=Dyadobacter jejuensis TaxID=1082580 RepID=A0A315ZQ45_9BACT|nr:GNAT family protein [Dyadobacter jejuensis]PWJ47223.1 hypothetical protein CLV98_1682 [Dyadobacter jejuensis]